MSGTQITIVGNLTADPELRFTPSGAAVASFNVAVNERKYNKDTGQWEDGGATYWKCNVWRGMAENLAESLTKGDNVIVVGTVQDRSFEGKDGEKRTVKEIEVAEVGPSLRFAQAKPVKSNKGGNGGGQARPAGQAKAADDPWASAGDNGEAPF